MRAPVQRGPWGWLGCRFHPGKRSWRGSGHTAWSTKSWGAQSVSPIPIGLSLTERYSRGGTREFPGYHTLRKNAVPIGPVCQVSVSLECLYLLLVGPQSTTSTVFTFTSHSVRQHPHPSTSLPTDARWPLSLRSFQGLTMAIAPQNPPGPDHGPVPQNFPGLDLGTPPRTFQGLTMPPPHIHQNPAGGDHAPGPL